MGATSASARQAFIGVGANLGDRWATICAALAGLAAQPGLTGIEASAVFETTPVGVLDQPRFLNLVVGVDTTLTPESLLAVLQERERAAGRRRAQEVRWGPRPLDLDLLLFEGETRDGPDIVLPHPRMWERAFVLIPLRDLFSRVRRFQAPQWAELAARLAAVPPSPDVVPWRAPRR